VTLKAHLPVTGRLSSSWGTQNRTRRQRLSCGNSQSSLSCWGRVLPLFLSPNNRSTTTSNWNRSRSCRPWRETQLPRSKVCRDSLPATPGATPRHVEIQQILYDVSAAVQSGDGQSALNRAAGMPNFRDGDLLFLKALAIR
jgi:hypothetical protein